MALQKQLAHINITGSVERKDDGFLVIPSKLTRADDVVWDDASTPIVRGGQTKFSLHPTLSLHAAVRMFEHGNVPVIELQNGTQLRAEAGDADYGFWKGNYSIREPTQFTRVGVTTRRLASTARRTGVYAEFDTAVGASNYALVQTTDDGSVDITIRDTDSDSVLAARRLDGSTFSEGYYRPRVIYDSANARYAVFAFRSDSGAATFGVDTIYINATTFVASSPGTAVSFAGLAITTTYLLDVQIVDGEGTYGLCVLNPVSGLFRFLVLDDALAVLFSGDSGALATPPTSLAVYAELADYGSGEMWHVYALYAASTALMGITFLSVGGAGAEVTIQSTAPDLVGRIAVYPTAAGVVEAVYDTFATTTSTNPTTRLLSITLPTLTAVAAYTVGTNCFLAGRVFTMRNRYCVPVVFESLHYQSTLFVLDLSEVRKLSGGPHIPYFMARLSYGECIASGMASDLGAARRVPSAYSTLLPYLRYETDLRLAGTANVTASNITRAVFDEAGQLGDVEVNGVTVLAGACPLLCDGRQIVEEGFHWAPECSATALTPVTTGTGVFSFPNTTGTYTVTFTEVWQDAQGNWHESGTSADYTVSITAGSGLLDINPTFIRPPSMKSGRFIVMYRTLISSTDTTLYLAHTGQLDGTGEVAEAVLASGEAIYTTGDVLPNEPMPSCRHLSLYQGRVVAAGTEDGFGVAWSKETEKGYGVEFCASDPLHRLRVPASLGRAVGARELDDRLFIICERGVGIIYGTGPSATGLAGGYSDFNTIITETGCDWSSPKSIARAPEGIWFFSPFGIRLISRAGGLARGQDGKQVGAEVDDLVLGVSSPRVVAVTGNGKQQVRFYYDTTDGNVGRVLVWDYQWQKWSRFNGHAHVDACYAGDRYYHVNNVSSVAQLRYYDETAIRDVGNTGSAGQVFAGTIETAWLQFAGIQGFQRVYRLMVLGKNTNTQPVTVVGSFFYDFSSTADSDVMTATPITPTASGVVQVQHHMVRQKCEALKIRIEMNANATVPATSGRFRLTDLTLQVGVKPGYYKLPSSQRY